MNKQELAKLNEAALELAAGAMEAARKEINRLRAAMEYMDEYEPDLVAKAYEHARQMMKRGTDK